MVLWSPGPLVSWPSGLLVLWRVRPEGPYASITRFDNFEQGFRRSTSPGRTQRRPLFVHALRYRGQGLPWAPCCHHLIFFSFRRIGSSSRRGMYVILIHCPSVFVFSLGGRLASNRGEFGACAIMDINTHTHTSTKK
jgi:hypothetical protein